MEDRLELVQPRLAELSAHPEREVRARAALAAGRVRGPGSTPILLALLSDSSAYVRRHAAFAFGLARDSANAVVDSLASMLHDAPPGDTAVPLAAFALGRIGTTRAREVVRTILDTTRVASPADPIRVAELLLAAWRLPRDPALVNAVMRMAAAPPGVRGQAVYALMRMAAPAGVSVLLDALADGDPYIRSLAARGLAPGPVDSAGRRAEVLPALIAALADVHPHVRINAAGALGRYRDLSAAAPLTRLLDDADDNVAVAAAGALAQLGEQPAAGAALAAVADDAQRAGGVRAAALAALVDASPTSAASIAARWADSASWLARMHAARAFGRLPWHAAQNVLPKLARDADGRVATAALASIRASADSASAGRAFFIEGLAHADADARAAAIRGLAAARDPADFALLMESYERARNETLNDAALAAVDALAAFDSLGIPVARSFQLRFPRHQDPAVQRRVAARMGADAWGPPDPVEHDRGERYYEEIVRELVAPVIAGAEPPVAEIRTAGGAIRIQLAATEAPRTVQNFLELVRAGYYGDRGDPESARWHRVVPNFVLQDGDSRGDGSGGPGHTIRDEVNLLRYSRGMVGMAHAGPHTAGGQFFITLSPQPHLDGDYTIFGRVLSGMDVADVVVQDDRIGSITIVP